MRKGEQTLVIRLHGFPEEQTEQWYEKYRRHRDSAITKGTSTELSFNDYMLKAAQAGMGSPEEIGTSRDNFNLGRIGDVGPYTKQGCRFITVAQNRQECLENHGYSGGPTEKKPFKGIHTDESRAILAQQRSKNFVVIAPDGTEHRGSNLKEFSLQNNLHVFSMYDVFAGRKRQHRGWTGYYE